MQRRHDLWQVFESLKIIYEPKNRLKHSARGHFQMFLLQRNRQTNFRLGLAEQWCRQKHDVRWAWNSMQNSSNDFHLIRLAECSRRRAAAEANGRIDSTLHCLPNGNFEELQCDSGICWCADERTGRVMNGSRAVPEHLWTTLPCCKSNCHSHISELKEHLSPIRLISSHDRGIRIVHAWLCGHRSDRNNKRRQSSSLDSYVFNREWKK